MAGNPPRPDRRFHLEQPPVGPGYLLRENGLSFNYACPLDLRISACGNRYSDARASMSRVRRGVHGSAPTFQTPSRPLLPWIWSCCCRPTTGLALPWAGLTASRRLCLRHPSISLHVCQKGGAAVVADRRDAIVSFHLLVFENDEMPYVPLDDVTEVSNYVAAIRIMELRGCEMIFRCPCAS